MKKIILSINAGSSSVKISVYSSEQNQDPEKLAETQITGITAPPAKLTYTRRDETVIKNREVTERLETQNDAFKILLRTLTEDAGLPEIASKNDIAIACHRIVHGGDYTSAQVINQDTLHHLEALTDLAPLHNIKALQIVQSCVAELPGAANVACFDSQFHASIPEHIYTYPIDPVVARKNQLRKYGFHGISYQFITRAVARFLGRAPADLNLIALHLGSGASACAIKNGRSWDTSMGLTPLAGLPGATRSGSVDPSLVFHYASDVGKLSPNSTKDLHISEAEEILNLRSGWAALTGTTDFGAIASASASAGVGPEEEDRAAKNLAFDLFVDRVCGYVGSYYVSLGGRVDALVFAGGIGERSARLRAAVAAQAGCLGFAVDGGRNEAVSGSGSGAPGKVGEAGEEAAAVVRDVGREGARHRTLVCFTDEQFEMARGCAEDPELW
ncbi:acetate and butyrate kinase-like protein [Biscogniauxia mediterranea]|nr:acetate and butyrate kinase-like protein [Biscogniauxia mediterranea]